LAWEIEFSPAAQREIEHLDRTVAERIVDYLEYVLSLESPRDVGKSLKGHGKLWRYQVGDWRVIVDLQYARLLIMVVKIGNRREVYR
jgi:mRNA interferase RelE/StbE